MDDHTSEQLRRREREAFIAARRHDLRTPINAILGYSEMVLDEMEDGRDPRAGDVRKINDAGRALLASIDEILHPDKIATGQTDLTDLPALAERLRLELRTDINAVVGYAELLLEDVEANEEDEEEDIAADLERIRAAAAGMTDLIDEIVAFRREPSPRAALEPADASRATMVSDLMATIGELEERRAESADEPGHILIVDDNETNRQLLARRLAREGHSFDTAADGREALALAEAGSFDLVLLDILMPEMDGFQVLSRLKASEELRHIPVIMLSALDQIESVVRCIEMGAEDFLQKPFDPVLLRARIGASLEKKRLRDREQDYLRQLSAEREKSERLLLNILPAPIADQLKHGETTIADSVPEATVLFADLVGFTSISARLEARTLVARLNETFSTFDQLTAVHGAEKIKTVGDAYMAVGGLPTPRPDHAERIADLALDMLVAIEQTRERISDPFDVRIGINSGPVVAGVIGATKFAYDLWGDTVNTASRMESTGVPGRIQVTDWTRELLEPRFCFERRGMVQVKGKGELETHFLVGRRC